jgi:hypothetical protein
MDPRRQFLDLSDTLAPLLDRLNGTLYLPSPARTSHIP